MGAADMANEELCVVNSRLMHFSDHFLPQVISISAPATPQNS